MRVLPLLAIFAGLTASADAADLSRQSALGAVFAERPARSAIPTGEPPPGLSTVYVRVPGYYGGYDTPYRNYYGTSPVSIFTRLPYACKWHGLC